MNGAKKQQHKNSTRDEIAPESYHVHIEKKMIDRKCSIKVQLLSHNGMENTGVICILICHLSLQVYIVQNLNEKYVYLIFHSTHTLLTISYATVQCYNGEDGKYRSDMHTYISFITRNVHCSGLKLKICIFNFSQHTHTLLSM